MFNEVDRYKLQALAVAIIDDHEVVLEGFCSYMLKHGVGCVETFSVADALLQRMQARQFDIYVVDVELTDMDIVCLIDEIRRRHAGARIIVNTMHEEMWVVRRMADMHVDGVMYKSADLDQLLQAVLTVSEGGQFYCSKFKKSVHHIDVQHDVLSPREQEVLNAIAGGLSTKDIAKQLYISENTVETHRQNLFAKLRAHNMADLVMKAIACGYINPKFAK